MRTYRVENGRGQAGSSHQLKAQSATALLRSQHFLGAASVDRSFHAPQFAGGEPFEEIGCRRVRRATQPRDRTLTHCKSHSLTRVHRTSGHVGEIHTVGRNETRVARLFLGATPSRRIRYRDTFSKIARAAREYSRDYVVRVRSARTTCTVRYKRSKRVSRSISSSRWCSPGTGVGARLLGGLSAFIAPGWLRMSFCLRATGMQLNARRRWRGKKHVPDSQNRGAVTRRCCGARRPIDHQSLPSRMRRSLPHDFGVPTPKRVPYIVYTISLRLVLSLLSLLPRLSPSPFLILFSPRSRSSSLLRSARAESTRQLPCLRATLPLTRLLGQDQCGTVCIWVEPCRRWRGGGLSRSPTVDRGDKPQLCRAVRHRATPCGALKRPSRPSPRSLLPDGGGACRGRCSVPRSNGESRRRHCFRRATRKVRRVRDPRRRPASRRHSRTQRRRRRRPTSSTRRRRPTTRPSYPVRRCRAVPRGSLFTTAEVSSSLCAYVSACGKMP